MKPCRRIVAYLGSGSLLGEGEGVVAVAVAATVTVAAFWHATSTLPEYRGGVGVCSKSKPTKKKVTWATAKLTYLDVSRSGASLSLFVLGLTLMLFYLSLPSIPSFLHPVSARVDSCLPSSLTTRADLIGDLLCSLPFSFFPLSYFLDSQISKVWEHEQVGWHSLSLSPHHYH